ncbi:ABC transporter permease [Natribacillus halophilus]|uniref:Putative hemin transport system permease protein HrtB n=1 Tax=Natribacillus halophilus TaxID=549003 RepID=A0A1G8QME1_9BACI|nr:ABC transporter permease [Natribacillus halophilus]SDJ05959.1 putative ABC transport system permease protein [Natribacillus halophilus]
MFLAIRELLYSKLRYIMVALIIFLLSFLVLFVSGLAQGLAYDNASSIINMDETAEYFVMDDEAEMQLTRSLVDDEDQQTVHDEVDQSEILGVHQGTIEDDEESQADVAKFYLDDDSALFPEVTEGEKPSEQREVLADESLQEEGYHVGDEFLEDTTEEIFTITGFTSNQKYSHTPVIYVTEEDWLELSGGDELLASALVLPDIGEETVSTLNSQLTDAEVVTIQDSLSGIPGYSEEQMSLWMMIVFLFIISAFVLAAFFYVITIQKLTQFGILKAIGTKVSELANTILVQVGIISVVSVTIGIGATFLAAALLPPDMPFMLPLNLVATLTGLFIVVAILGSLLSLYKVKKVDALEAIGGMEA